MRRGQLGQASNVAIHTHKHTHTHIRLESLCAHSSSEVEQVRTAGMNEVRGLPWHQAKGR